MLLVLVLFLTVFTFYLFFDIGSDGIVTLWERAARSGYNMFSEPCQVLLNKGDVHNCRLYDTIEIDTRVCVQVVYELLE